MTFQLRLWLTVALIPVAGALVLLLGTSALYEQVLIPFEAVQSQSLNAVKGQLVKHGSDAVDVVMKASVDEAVRAAAKKAQLTPEAEAALLGRAGSSGAPSFAVILKTDGTLAARAGEDVKLDLPVAGLPVFVDAKAGFASDRSMDVNGKMHHIAAAPVYEGGELVGVVLAGWPYDASFADELSRQANTNVIMVASGTRLGSALPELTVDDLKVRGSGFGALDLGSIPPLLPVLVADKGRFVAASLPLFGGVDTQVVTVTDRNPALKAMATAQALIIVGTLMLTLFQAGIIIISLRGIRRPIAVIMDHLAQFQQGGSVGILPEAQLSGPFLRLGKQINMILQMMPSAARPGAPLGQLSGSLGGLGSGPSPLGAGFDPNAAGDDHEPPPPLKTPPRPAGSPVGGDLRLPSAPPTQPNAQPSMPLGAANGGGLASLFDDGPDPLAAFRVQPGAGPSGGAAPPQPPQPPPPDPSFEAGPSGPSPMQPEATVMFQVPQELIQQSAEPSTGAGRPPVPPTPSVPMSSRAPQVDDARTVVAQVPQELLSAVTPKQDVAAQDEAHYREVYDKFVETRIQCGEDTSDLTYERFVAKLLKNRQQIVEKHKAKSVRFQVYVKEGKAALRALPVREP